MPTPLYLNGFENRVLAVGGITTNAIWSSFTNTACTITIDTTIFRGAGARSLKIAVPTITSQAVLRANFAAQTKLAYRFYFRKSGNPSQTNFYIHSSAPGGSIFFLPTLQTDGTLQLRVNGGTGPVNGSSIAIANDTWCCVDVVIDVSTTAHRARMWVDGVQATTDATTTAAAPGSLVQVDIGKVQSGTNTTARDIYFDDYIIGTAANIDDRFGPTNGIVGLVPDADGTHLFTSGAFTDAAGVNISPLGTPNAAWDNLDSGDLNQTTEHVKQPLDATGAYCELSFGTTTLSAAAPLGVQAEVGLNTDGTNAFTANTRARNGTTETTIGATDWSIAAGTKCYQRGIVAVANQGELDGLKMRIGYGTLQPAIPYWEALMFEVDVGISTGPSTLYGITSMAVAFGSTVSGTKKTFSSSALPVTFAAQIDGRRKALGQIAFPVIFGKEVQGQRKTFGQLLSPFTFGKEVLGRKTTFGKIDFPINVVIGTAGFRPGVTLYGALTLPIVFGAATDGKRKTLGQLAFPITFNKDVRGQRKTFGQLLSPFIFGKAVSGQRKTFSQVSFPLSVVIATAGLRPGLTFYGTLALPITFGKDVRGQRKAFGQVALPLTFVKDTRGQRKTFGQLSLPIIFTKEAIGRKNVFGQLSMQTLFGKEIAGRRKTFSQLAMPMIFSKAVAGRKQTFGRVALPIDFQAFVDGQIFIGPKTYYGQLAMPLAFGKQVAARRKTFGQITSPFIFGSASKGQRHTFSELELPIDFLTYIKSGPVGKHGSVELELVLAMNTDGKIVIAGVILNDALELYLGDQNILAAYVGSEKVWP